MKGSCFFSFLGGAAIGAMIALLTAPDSGANTRHKIAGKIKQGGQKVKDTLEEGYHSTDPDGSSALPWMRRITQCGRWIASG